MYFVVFLCLNKRSGGSMLLSVAFLGLKSLFLTKKYLYLHSMSRNERIPQHVAIIMDGNGRWAEIRGKERSEGHIYGVETVRTSIRASVRWGVKYLTLYAFSSENWGRPQGEVDGLMELFCKCIEIETPELVKQGVRVEMIGDRCQFSQKVQSSLSKIENDTVHGDKLTLVLALNYSAREEIVRATRLIADRVSRGELKSEDVDATVVSQSLYTKSHPDPDFIIRTSGESRLSNFLLWQASYAELYFPETLWPDFNELEFDKAMEEYARRNRRFGLVN